MENSKVVQVLKQLDSKELSALLDYLDSPLFNKNKILGKITSILLSFKDDFESEKLSHELLLHKVYDKKNQKIERLRNDFTLLFKEIKKFLAIQEYLKHEEENQINTLKAFRKKGLNNLFESELKKINKEHDSSKNEPDYYRNYLIHDEMDKFFLNKRTRVYDPNLQSKMNALDNFYLTVKLKEVCEMLNRNAIYEKKYEVGIEALLNDVLPNESLDNFDPLVPIYYATYQMLKTNDNKSFQALMNLLEEKENQVPKDEIRELYIHAQNFCTRKINQGEAEYFSEVFGIFKRLIKNNLLLSDGQIPHTTYKNIVTTALNVNENEWTKDFIEEYKNHLNDGIKESAYSYNMAKYAYEVGDIDEAVKLLQSVNYEDNYYQIDARYLLLKIFYETNEHESLLYCIDAFKLYLKRNKNFNIKTRELIITFLKLLRKTAILKNRKPYLSKDDFKVRLENLNAQFMINKSIPYRKWVDSILQDLNR